MLLRILKVRAAVKLTKYAKGDFRFYLNMLLHVVSLESRYVKLKLILQHSVITNSMFSTDLHGGQTLNLSKS